MELQNDVVELRYGLWPKVEIIGGFVSASSFSVYCFLHNSMIPLCFGILMAIIITIKNRKYFNKAVILTLNTVGVFYDDVMYPWSKIKSARINVIDGGENGDKNILVLVLDDSVKEISINGLDKSPSEISVCITQFAKQAQLKEGAYFT